jgi:ABC-type sugar transport system substrate-binding protein
MNRRQVLISTAAALGAVPLSSLLGQAQQRRIRIGFSVPEAQNPFYVALGRSVSDTLRARGIEPMLLSADADVNAQVSNLHEMVAAKVDAILVSPLDLHGPAPAIRAAVEAKIPVIMVGRALDEKYKELWRSYIAYNFTDMGTAKGKWVVGNLKPGKIALLSGPAGSQLAIEQEDAFRKIVEPAGFTIAFAQHSTQTRENGLKLAEDALVAHRDLKCIYASNDDLALGAAQAVKAANLKGQVGVIGLNGSPPALASIHNGDMTMTILLAPDILGKAAANAAADLVQKQIQPPPVVWLPFSVVTEKEAYDLIPPPLRERLGVKPRT